MQIKAKQQHHGDKFHILKINIYQGYKHQHSGDALSILELNITLKR